MIRYRLSNINKATYQSEIEQLVSGYVENAKVALFINPNQSPNYSIIKIDEIKDAKTDSEIEDSIDSNLTSDIHLIDSIVFGGNKLKLDELKTTKPNKTKKRKKSKSKNAKSSSKPKLDSDKI